MGGKNKWSQLDVMGVEGVKGGLEKEACLLADVPPQQELDAEHSQDAASCYRSGPWVGAGESQAWVLEGIIWQAHKSQ